MFITADQVLAHAIGDYILQSHWMANEKTKKSLAAIVHAVTYTVPFLFITQSIAALAIICGTHFLIDRFRLARYIVHWKNYLSPRSTWPTDLEGYTIVRNGEAFVQERRKGRFLNPTNTGYPEDTPPWMAVWLLIIADNILHVVINGVAIKFFG